MNGFDVEIPIGVTLQSFLLDALNVIVAEDDFDVGRLADEFGNSAANADNDLVREAHGLAGMQRF
jgi:hypothetical protein